MHCVEIYTKQHICIIILWMSSVYAQKHKQICKNCTEKHFVVQCFILIVCNNHVYKLVYVALVNSKWINDQMNFYATYFYTTFWFPFQKFGKI